ncbi:hypothetical protein MHZ92_12350 [Sporosarcina sp. ACRSL]|uniref:hypothetical protein n=1 Tax=Sporosarcina sp. ACRSL TaxID=2918215 RepID=UPI001EF73E5A|nr:hypothetical protein [Sporosarcina sp. ACRSL]MCG7344930.1 hypothetical protein [Sporosarcina sp. ACRSL]
MKRIIIFLAVIGLVLAGCSAKNGDNKNDSTKQRVYSNSWDGNPIIVKQRFDVGEYETVNEITDNDEVDELIRILGNVDWLEKIKAERIRDPDYRFSWNSFEHDVWINQNIDRLELSIHGQSNLGVLSANSSKVVLEILTGNTEITSGTEENVAQESHKYVAKKEGELSLQDSETAYEMCVRALTDYYKAVWNGSDIELDIFIENENLKQYTQKKIQSQFKKYGHLDGKVKDITISDTWEVEFTDDADGGFLYLHMPAVITKYHGGGYGEPTEFLVRNINGKLVIVDWYTGGKDTYDFMVRGENETITAPTIWNDSDWVKKLISKQRDFSGSTR